MKSFALPTLALLLAALLGGCSTIESRIKEKPAAFASVDPATQKKIREGVVEVGYSPDLVYIVLGQPDDEIQTITKHGEDSTWIYRSYGEDYVGTARTGYRRYVVRDPRTGQAFVYIEPVYTEVYQEHTEDRIRIIFKEGKVAVIEEAKR